MLPIKPWAGGGLHTARLQVSCPRAPRASMPPDVLGHLHHHVQLQRPQELGVVMCDVPLDRVEELLLGPACKLRPALAVSDPSVPFGDRGHSALVLAASRHVARPTERVSWCYPGVHASA